MKRILFLRLLIASVSCSKSDTSPSDDGSNGNNNNSGSSSSSIIGGTYSKGTASSSFTTNYMVTKIGGTVMDR